MPTATPMHVADVEQLLESSKATPEFAAALRAFAKTKTPSPLIKTKPGVPLVKAVRAISMALEQLPQEPIRSVEIEASSGCSDFRGRMIIHGATTRTVRFVWDCAWKAEQQGWKTMFGDWDQQRAAQEFGYRCFEVWQVE